VPQGLPATASAEAAVIAAKAQEGAGEAATQAEPEAAAASPCLALKLFHGPSEAVAEAETAKRDMGLGGTMYRDMDQMNPTGGHGDDDGNKEEEAEDEIDSDSDVGEVGTLPLKCDAVWPTGGVCGPLKCVPCSPRAPRVRALANGGDTCRRAWKALPARWQPSLQRRRRRERERRRPRRSRRLQRRVHV
jgi:hypothetical protein